MSQPAPPVIRKSASPKACGLVRLATVPSTLMIASVPWSPPQVSWWSLEMRQDTPGPFPPHAVGHQAAHDAPQWKLKNTGRPVLASAVPKAVVMSASLLAFPLNRHLRRLGGGMQIKKGG